MDASSRISSMLLVIILLVNSITPNVQGFLAVTSSRHGSSVMQQQRRQECDNGPAPANGALSSDYLENDFLAIQLSSSSSDNSDSNNSPTPPQPRLCAVRPNGDGVYPLCQREDDVETDLFVDPREFSNSIWLDVTDDMVTGTYGEGWYGQRPVSSLGGGPGYGAEADDIWSVSEDVIETIRNDGVDLPILDMGIAHGEKAGGGSF